MQARIALIALIAATFSITTAVRVSADASAVALAPGALIVPPAWAGVWDVYEETTSECAPGTTTRTYRDTLCAGDTVQVLFAPFPPDFVDCTGIGFTDTGLNITCVNAFDCHQCCLDGSWLYVAVWISDWSLSGDVATTTFTYDASITASCTSSHQCSKTTGTRTRVWPESSFCGLTPVQRQSWGSLKIRYQ